MRVKLLDTSILKKDVIVVHRINECDERKGTNNMNVLLKEQIIQQIILYS